MIQLVGFYLDGEIITFPRGHVKVIIQTAVVSRGFLADPDHAVFGLVCGSRCFSIRAGPVVRPDSILAGKFRIAQQIFTAEQGQQSTKDKGGNHVFFHIYAQDSFLSQLVSIVGIQVVSLLI